MTYAFRRKVTCALGRAHKFCHVRVVELQTNGGFWIVGVRFEFHQPVAFDGVRDVLQDIGGNVELGEAPQAVHNVVFGHARTGSIPERKRSDPVGMKQLGTGFQLGKASQKVARLLGRDRC